MRGWDCEFKASLGNLVRPSLKKFFFFNELEYRSVVESLLGMHEGLGSSPSS